MIQKKLASNLFVACITTLLAMGLQRCVNNIADTGQEKPSGHSVSEINKMYESLQPVYSGDMFIETPAVTAPYAPGSLEQGVITDGINMTNFVRYLAHVPYDLTTEHVLNNEGQYGAVLLAASNFSHEPDQPNDMDVDFYNTGKMVTSSSNIAMGFSTLANAIQNGYMRDDDAGNLTTVGHRRWVLYPPLKRTGFGLATRGLYSYSTMKVFDNTRATERSENIHFDYIAWPSAGNFPIEFFDANDPWSISLNTSAYLTPSVTSVTVTLKRHSDQRVFTFNENDNTVTISSEYFQVDTQGYGLAACIIFRPSSADISSLNAETFTVTVNGLYDKEGNVKIISYDTTFFSLSIP